MFKQKEKIYQLLSFILLGSVVFLVSAFVVEVDILISFILSIITVGAFIYIYKKRKEEEMQIETINNEHAEPIAILTKEIRQDLKNVTVAMLQIRNKKVNLRLGESTRRVRNVLNEIEHNTIDAKAARRFIIVYIAGLERIILSYIEINSMQKLYSSIETLEERFDEELETFKKNNILSA